MTTLINSRKEIPNAPYYVMCNDTFMSNWGDSKNRINTIILPCHNMTQANLVVERIKAWRTDQNRIRIVSSKPKLDFNTHTYSLFNHSNAGSWYPGHKIQRIEIQDSYITIMRETGTRKYYATLDRVLRLLNTFDPAEWHEFESYYVDRFTPRAKAEWMYN